MTETDRTNPEPSGLGAALQESPRQGWFLFLQILFDQPDLSIHLDQSDGHTVLPNHPHTECTASVLFGLMYFHYRTM
jgi:hypothetical protein